MSFPITRTVLPRLKDLWVDWGIHFLVTISLACDIVLTILGIRRKHQRSELARFIVWAAYLLLSYIVKVALGKLTVIRIDDPENPGYDMELEGLLAPLLLLQIGYPDGITAYGVEDNQLGLRQILNIGATVVFVVRVLNRCRDGWSLVSRLYIPLFFAGFIKSALWVWALKSVYDENSIVNAEYLPEEAAGEATEPNVQLRVFHLDEKYNSAKDILKAYLRFDCLKPHLKNWPYHPTFISPHWMSIDSYSVNRAFTVNEIELNFMFDVLYTKAPILYTKRGIIARFIGFFCLVSALCGFTVILKNAFLIDMYITYTYALLMAVTSLELYQITMLAFSDWAVVMMSQHLRVPLFSRLLPLLADHCKKKKRWSRSIGQLNLLDHCRFYRERPKLVHLVLDWFGKREIFSCHWLHNRPTIPASLKTLVVQKMTKLEEERDLQPFTERGKWTLKIHSIPEKQGLSGSIETPFNRSIIIWHIATTILHKLESEKSDTCRGSKLLSNYMIYLFALHPDMLSLTSADTTLKQACCILRPFLRYRNYEEAISTLSSPDGDVPHPITLSSPDGDVPHPVKPSKETRITRDWNVLSEVQKLVVDLRTMDNKWEIISSIWVEMLCYAAYKCRVYHHAKLLRRGGELITHVWLLLAHKTNNYPYNKDEPPEISLLGKGFF